MKYIILLNVLVWGSALAALPAAIDTEQSNNQAVVELHKAFLADNMNDIDDDVSYQASAQAANTRHANEFIKNNRSDGL
jgi:hypothetical protein